MFQVKWAVCVESSWISVHLLGQTEDLLPAVVTLLMAFPENVEKRQPFYKLVFSVTQIIIKKKSSLKCGPITIWGLRSTGTHHSPANERAINQSAAWHEQPGSLTILEMGHLWQLPLLRSSIIWDKSLPEGFGFHPSPGKGTLLLMASWHLQPSVHNHTSFNSWV